MNLIHHFGTFLLFAATVLMVVVSVGLPVWNEIYFLRLSLSGSSTLSTLTSNQSLLFGPWGICYGSTCTASKLGYNLSFVESLTDNAVVISHVVKALSYTFVLHPIAAGLCCLAFLFALGNHLATGICASLLALVASLVTLAAFVVTIVFAEVAKHKLEDAVDGANGTLGRGIWLVLVAFVLQLIASITVCCVRSRDNRRARGGYGNGNQQDMTQTGSRRNLWGRRAAY